MIENVVTLEQEVQDVASMETRVMYYLPFVLECKFQSYEIIRAIHGVLILIAYEPQQEISNYVVVPYAQSDQSLC